MVWDGPQSSGVIATGGGASGGQPKAVIRGEGINKTYTWDEGEGYSSQVGTSDQGGVFTSWITITVPGKNGDSSSWVEMGTETHGGTQTEYTINGTSHADGSSEFSRVSHDNLGDRETTFGGTDKEGNSSYSERTEHADGSVTLVTRTVDKHGNGQEHVTTVDANGNVTSDGTIPVVGGQTGGAAGSGGTPGGGTPAGAPPSNEGDEENKDKDDDKDKEDDKDKDDDKDPNDPAEPDQPDAPDDGGDKGGGRPSDEGGGGDEAPPRPWEGTGHRHGDIFSELLNGLRSGFVAGDEDGALGFGIDEWLGELGDELGRAGGADETGWGGGEGPGSQVMISGTLSVPRAGADDSGWGDLTDPRALVAYVSALAEVTSPLAGAANLAKAVG